MSVHFWKVTVWYTTGWKSGTRRGIRKYFK